MCDINAGGCGYQAAVATVVKVEEDEQPPGEREGCVELARGRVSYGGKLQERLRPWTGSSLFQ